MQMLPGRPTQCEAAWSDKLLHAVASILSEQCRLLVPTVGGLLSYIERAAADGSQPAKAAVTTFCQDANLHGFWAMCVHVVALCQQLRGKYVLCSQPGELCVAPGVGRPLKLQQQQQQLRQQLVVISQAHITMVFLICSVT